MAGAILTLLAIGPASTYIHSVILRALLLSICLSTAATAQVRPAAQKPATPPAFEPDATALGALALLPKGAADNVARIEGPDGRPFPARWYVLVHDAAAPRGLREFVFAEAKLVTSRELSQFADTLTADDVIGAKAIKLNSDQAAGIAAQFAMLNGGQLATIRYELLRNEEAKVPEWHLTCADAKGQPLGSVVLHATKGTLLRFEGFEKSPMAPQPETAVAEAELKPAPPAAKPAKRSTSSSSTASARPPAPAPRATPVRRQSRPPRDEGVGGLFRRIFRD